MATITVTVDMGTTGGTVSKTFTVSNTNVARLAKWIKTNAGSPVDGDGTTLTDKQALERWIEWTMQMSRDHLIAHERTSAPVTDFTF